MSKFYDIKVYKKQENTNIIQYLNHSEIACKCQYDECTHTLFNERTARAFYLLRSYYGKPLHISSGFRCQIHNKDVGGVNGSYHTLGCALDIVPNIPEDLEKVADLARKFFDVVIVYKDKNFVHCHMEVFNE